MENFTLIQSLLNSTKSTVTSTPQFRTFKKTFLTNWTKVSTKFLMSLSMCIGPFVKLSVFGVFLSSARTWLNQKCLEKS